MRELTKTYGELLQDKRVRGEQNKYEAFSRQRNAVLNKYRKVYQAYTDLEAGLDRAKQFYEEMKETVDSLKKNVESFVENRRSEGGQLLSAIEAAKGSGADREQTRLKELMERMSVSPTPHSSQSPVPQSATDQRGSSHRPPPLQNIYSAARSAPISPQYQPNGMQAGTSNYQSFQRPTSTNAQFRDSSNSQGPYNPNNFPPVSPPAHQQYFSPPPNQQHQQSQRPSTTMYGQQPQQYGQSVPPGWQPPPPPPGPPPNQYQDFSALQATQYPSGPGGYASDPRRSGQQASSTDPWAGLNAWK